MSVFRSIKKSFERLIKRIKNFVLSKRSREFSVFLFFFVIASGFWLLQTLDDYYEVELSVPVILQNVPRNAIITQEIPSNLTIRVKDKGTVLLSYILSKNLYPVTINFNAYKDTGNKHVRIPTVDLEKTFLSQLNPSTKVISIKPDELEYIYSNGEYRRIRIKITGNIRPALQYYLSDTLIKPYYIMAYAPQQILKTLKYAYTEPITLNNLTGSITCQASLKPVNGVKFVPSKVMLTFKTDIYSEKSVEVPLKGINFPKGKELLTFPSKVTVTFQVGSVLYKKIKASDFSIDIPYEELLRYGKDKYPLHLTIMPKGIRNIRISPTQVDFLIEQNSNNVN
jgi:hypothetical protein